MIMKPRWFKKIWGHFVGTKMSISTPLMIDEYSNHIESANVSDFKTMRNGSTIEYDAEFNFPGTNCIFFENCY